MDTIDETVLRCLRTHLRKNRQEQVIDMTVDLGEYGLDSMRVIDLLMALEGEFKVVFPDDMLRQDVFETGTTLSNAIREFMAR